MTFHLQLKGNRAEYLAKKYIELSLKQQKKKQRIIETWIKENSDFDTQAAFDLWEDYRKQYGRYFLEEAIKTHAIANSVLDVNRLLSTEMKMESSGFEAHYVNQILDKLNTISVYNILVSNSDLPQSVKEDILSRSVAKQFPNKELNRPKPVADVIGNIKKQVEQYVDTPDELVDDGT